MLHVFPQTNLITPSSKIKKMNYLPPYNSKKGEVLARGKTKKTTKNIVCMHTHDEGGLRCDAISFF